MRWLLATACAEEEAWRTRRSVVRNRGRFPSARTHRTDPHREHRSATPRRTTALRALNTRTGPGAAPRDAEGCTDQSGCASLYRRRAGVPASRVPLRTTTEPGRSGTDQRGTEPTSD